MNDNDIETGAALPAQAQSRAAASLQELRRGLTNAKAAAPIRTLKPLLRMLKGGSWVCGREDAEVEPDSTWAINPFSILHGYVCWAEPGQPFAAAWDARVRAAVAARGCRSEQWPQ